MHSISRHEGSRYILKGRFRLRYVSVVVAVLILIVIGFRHEQTPRFYIFFGGSGFVAGVLGKRWFRESIERKMITVLVVCLSCTVLFGVAFLIVESSCFLCATKDEYRGSPEVFFPLVLDSEVSDSVNMAGSRVALLNEYGPTEIRRVIEKMSHYGWRSNLTLLLLALLLCSFTATIPIMTMNWELRTVNDKKLFISYSHDSEPHKQRVLDLAQQLRVDGIDVSLDRFVQSPPEGWPLWMLRQIDWADYVLCIFTERYHERCLGNQKPGEGKGVAWESTIMFNSLYGNPHFNTKFVPIVFDSGDEKWIVPPMHGFSHFRIQKLDLSAPGGYQDVYRLVTEQPMVTPAGIGTIHKLPPAKPRVTVKQTYSPSPSSPSIPIISIMQESELRKRLGELLPSMIDSIVADMEAESYVSGQNAPIAGRAIELVKFAKARSELDKLIKLYLEIISPK